MPNTKVKIGNSKSKSSNSQSATDFAYGWFSTYLENNPDKAERDLQSQPSSMYYHTEHDVRLAKLWKAGNQVFVKFFFPNLETESRYVTHTIKGTVAGLGDDFVDGLCFEFMKYKAIKAVENGEMDKYTKLIKHVNDHIGKSSNGVQLSVDKLCEKTTVTNQYGSSYDKYVYPISSLIAKIYHIVEQSDYKLDGTAKCITNNMLNAWHSEDKYSLTALSSKLLKIKLSSYNDVLSACTDTTKVTTQKTTTTKVVEESVVSKHADADI